MKNPLEAEMRRPWNERTNFLFLGGVDLASHVIATLRAYNMGGNRRAAFRAAHALHFRFMVMRPPRAGSGVTMFSFWNGHFIYLSQ